MRTYLILIASAMSLTGCGGNAPTAQQIGAALSTVQSISSSLACYGQSVANATTAAAQAAGDTNLATASSNASKATGALCTGLAVGTPLPQPAASAQPPQIAPADFSIPPAK
jgi:hypothetical protein